MSSIYFAPGTTREVEVCGSICLNTVHVIVSCCQRGMCN